MINDLHVAGFRRFPRYDINQMSNVNLLVGDNNSGKSSILEAVQILSTHADPFVLGSTCRMRGETSYVDESQSFRNRSPILLADVSHLFFGHEFDVGKAFGIYSDQGSASVNVELTYGEEETIAPRLFHEEFSGTDVPSLWMHIESRRYGSTLLKQEFEVRSDGLFDPQMMRRSRLEWQSVASPVLMITPDSLSSDSMAGMWDNVVEEGTEDSIVDAMRILDSNISSIVFLTRPRYSQGLDRSGVLIGKSGERKRFPLGSHGEGMRRLLALSLALACTRNGVLLLDEIDTGIHWSRMGEVWRLVIEAARQNRTQVFATTHSLDCIKGLSWVCENYEHLGQFVSVQSIKPELDEAVALPGERLPFAMSQEIEVR